MNKHAFLSIILCSLCFSPLATQANDKVETTYNAQKYQQVCKNKAQGDWVSFAYRGIIWNGRCEPQFFASSKNSIIKGDETELMTTCSADMNVKMTTIHGSKIKGQCALGFTPPKPQSQIQNPSM